MYSTCNEHGGKHTIWLGEHCISEISEQVTSLMTLPHPQV